MLELRFVSAVAEELNSRLSGGKIDSVRQPSKEIVILNIRSRGSNERLLLSASPSFARVHITTHEYESLSEPPMFCMLLRKHIQGAVITSVTQPVNDRVILFYLDYSDEYGRAFKEKLYIEMIPGKMNIILVDEAGIIIDCIYRREYEPDMYRRVFPGMIYHLPKQPDSFIPVSTARYDGGEYETLSAFLDDYYYEKEKQDIYRRRTKELRTSLNSARKRISKKLSVQAQELEKSAGRETVRRKADLITANIYRIRKGDRKLVCEDFYEDGCPQTEIELDPLKQPQENASRYYKEYNRLKTAEEYLSDLIAKGKEQLDYIDSVIDELDRADSNADIEGIREELIQSGVIKIRRGKNAKKQKKRQGNPDYIRFETPDGLEVFAGRNNLQNDELTFSSARKKDIWFHVKDYHGSHVILKTLGSQPTERDIMYAANVAVRYSQAKSSQNVRVDYTEVGNVRKSHGSLPGRVNYVGQHTVTVNNTDT